MREWLTGIVGENMATAAMLVIVTLAIVIAFVVLLTIFKGFGPTGIRSNRRTRQARLAVMDAAVVDSKRRLVLVRRDDVEHLVMIGGPSDVVIEQNIKRQRVASSSQAQPSRKRQVPAQAQPNMAPTPEEAPLRPTPQSQVAPVASKPKPAPPPQPQIRPVVTPPAPPPTAKPEVTKPAKKIEPAGIAAATVALSSAPVASSASQPSPPSAAPSPTVAPVVEPATASVPKKGEFTAPVSAASAPSAIPTAPVDRVSIEPAMQTAPPVVDNTESKVQVGDAPKVEEKSTSANQLAEFEDELAMNLGERLVPEESQDKEDNLANEMDELLNEITAGSER